MCTRRGSRGESKQWLADWREQLGQRGCQAHPASGTRWAASSPRYFLEVLDGWRDTRALITFGTPFRGSINAVDYLHHGMKKKLGPITLIDLTDLMRSFTSVHQLLPEYACVDAGAGLVRLADARRSKVSSRPGSKRSPTSTPTIAAKVEAHKDDARFPSRLLQRPSHRGYPPADPPVGRTRATARWNALRTYEGKDTDGDGTVPLQSATPLEWIDKNMEMFASERHASLQNFDAVLVQVDGLLRNETVRFREAPTNLSLDLDDMYDIAEPVTLGVKADKPDVAARRGDLRPHQRCRGEPRCRRPVVASGSSVELAPLPPGTYGVELLGMGAPPADPVHDVFVVFGDDDVARATELEEA